MAVRGEVDAVEGRRFVGREKEQRLFVAKVVEEKSAELAPTGFASDFGFDQVACLKELAELRPSHILAVVGTDQDSPRRPFHFVRAV